ncbi:hypothetical protein [Sulfobacillus harzensis]|nr:hypothetical protein [Sulfobacillus harzensis]
MLVDDQGVIRSVESLYTPPAGIKTMDARGAWVLPGMIGAHSKIGIFKR